MTTSFEILPAIDLRGGRVVRLKQGDFGRQTVYSDDPEAVACAFVAAGASSLHIVDLDGARRGTPAHTDVIRDIIRAVGSRAAVEVAGGLRTSDAVAAILELGAARVVLGTVAIASPDLVRTIVATFGADRVVAALDVRDGVAFGEAWRDAKRGVRAEESLLVLAEVGITTFEATSITKDGLLAGPDLELLRRLVQLDGGRLIASGGISSLEDIRAVRDLGCAGVILGRALYEGRIRLTDAIEMSAG